MPVFLNTFPQKTVKQQGTSHIQKMQKNCKKLYISKNIDKKFAENCRYPVKIKKGCALLGSIKKQAAWLCSEAISLLISSKEIKI